MEVQFEPIFSKVARASMNNKLPALFQETIASSIPSWEGKRNVHDFLRVQVLSWAEALGNPPGDTDASWELSHGCNWSLQNSDLSCRKYQSQAFSKALPLFITPLLKRGFS